MQDAKCLARQIVGAKNKKAELDKHIKKLERDLLDTQLVSALLPTIHNEGGETTDGPYTVEIPKTHIWDQSMVDAILEAIPQSDWPSLLPSRPSTKSICVSSRTLRSTILERLAHGTLRIRSS